MERSTLQYIGKNIGTRWDVSVYLGVEPLVQGGQFQFTLVEPLAQGGMFLFTLVYNHR